jgi:hypothetical protein
MGMRKTIHFVAAILLVTQGLAYAAPTPRNFALKTGTVKLNQYWRLTFEQDYTADDKGGDICLTQSDMGLACSPMVDWLELGINYRRIYERTEADPYKAVDRPHMNVTLRSRILALDISNSSRFEYRNLENQKNFWRYRNKFAVKFPFLLKTVRLQPYVAHELFTDLSDASDFARNGFSSGASLRLSANLMADFYYRRHASRHDGVWYDYTILGTSLRFTF